MKPLPKIVKESNFQEYKLVRLDNRLEGEDLEHQGRQIKSVDLENEQVANKVTAKTQNSSGHQINENAKRSSFLFDKKNKRSLSPLVNIKYSLTNELFVGTKTADH